MFENQRERTMTFSIQGNRDKEIHDVLETVYSALVEKGYNPLDQLVGYILSEDPTYITNHKNARALICKVDRDDILNSLVRNYLGI